MWGGGILNIKRENVSLLKGRPHLFWRGNPPFIWLGGRMSTLSFEFFSKDNSFHIYMADNRNNSCNVLWCRLHIYTIYTIWIKRSNVILFTFSNNLRQPPQIQRHAQNYIWWLNISRSMTSQLTMNNLDFCQHTGRVPQQKPCWRSMQTLLFINILNLLLLVNDCRLLTKFI